MRANSTCTKDSRVPTPSSRGLGIPPVDLELHPVHHSLQTQRNLMAPPPRHSPPARPPPDCHPCALDPARLQLHALTETVETALQAQRTYMHACNVSSPRLHSELAPSHTCPRASSCSAPQHSVTSTTTRGLANIASFLAPQKMKVKLGLLLTRRGLILHAPPHPHLHPSEVRRPTRGATTATASQTRDLAPHQVRRESRRPPRARRGRGALTTCEGS